MAIKYFNVKNGLTAGPITLDATSGNASATNLNVTGISNFGAVANVHITGGVSGQAIITDGSGNLTFGNVTADVSAAPMPTYIAVGNTVTISANYQGLFGYPITIDGTMTVDGVLVDVDDSSGSNTSPGGFNTQLQYNNAGLLDGITTVTYDGTKLSLGNVANVNITGGGSGQVLSTDGTGNLSWITAGAGGGGVPGGINTQIQFNDASSFGGNAGFTFNKTTGIFTAPYLAGNGNGLSNIQGANVSGAVGLATYASTANAVAGANVSGQVANALVAGTVYTNAQPNITSVGTLTSLTINGNISANNANITGNIVPTSNNIYSLGSASSYWKDAYIGPGSLYINGVKVLEESSNAIVISADLNQTVKVTSSGSGDVQLQTTGTGVIAVKGPLQIQAANYITSSTGGPIGFSNPINVDTLSSLSANTNLTISANGTGNIQLKDDVTIAGNLTVTGVGGNLSVTSLTVEDNIIDISAETTGVPVNNAGIRVMRGDDPAVQIRWNETSDTWQTTNDGSIYLNIVGSNTTTGNANVGNIGATSGVFTNVSGNGSSLTSITGANVTGQVSNALISGTVYTNAQPNITSVGTLTDLSVSGNGVFGGNLTVNGTLTYINSTTLSISDPIINLQTGANGAAPVANTGKDVGTALNYYDTSAKISWMGWDVSNAEIAFGSNVSIS